MVIQRTYRFFVIQRYCRGIIISCPYLVPCVPRSHAERGNALREALPPVPNYTNGRSAYTKILHYPTVW